MKCNHIGIIAYEGSEKKVSWYFIHASDIDSTVTANFREIIVW